MDPFIVGSLISAGGGILGSIFGNDSAKDQQTANNDFAWATNPHNMLESMSGGKYSEYLQDVAFRKPGEQAEHARKSMEIMFPELNPWELAGSQAAGVAGSMGADASSVASKNAQASAQHMAASMQANTQIKTAEINAKTNLIGKVIDAGVSIKNNQATNDTARANAVTSISPQMELMELTKANIQSDIESKLANTDLTRQRFETEVLNTINTHLQASGIRLSNEQKALFNEKITKEIQLMDYSKSEVGKMAHDATTIFQGAIQEAMYFGNQGLEFVKGQANKAFGSKRTYNTGTH